MEPVLHFDGFTLDPEQGRLTNPTGAERPLRHKCFRFLHYMAENAGRVVSREELLDAIWPGVIVGDDSVTQCVAEVRRALGEPGSQLLRTLPKRGYLFAAAVQRAAPSAPTAPRTIGAAHAAVPAEDVALSSIAGTASPSAAKVEAFLENYLVSEQEPGTVPFGGRDAVLEELDAWLDDPGAEPRLLLVAPSGRGKSALLAQWARRLTTTGRVGEGHGWWRLVFVPISLRFSTSRPAVFLEAVAARLAEILRTELPPARAEPTEHFTAQCRRLLAEAAAAEERVLIVVDGIDEALGGRFDAAWFPRRPGRGLRLLLSARQLVGDRDALGWAARPGWDGADRVRALDLPALTPEGVLALLRRAGGAVTALAARADVAVRLYDLTAGEPLLLRLHIEELRRRAVQSADSAADGLAVVAPGLRGVFQAWLGHQHDVWITEREGGETIDEALLESYLAVLACAHGPLPAEELDGMVSRVHAVPPGFRVERVLYPLRRFVIGTDRHGGNGYVLSHPRLGEFLRDDYFDAHRIEEVRQAFAAWGQDSLRNLNGSASAFASPYLLQFLGQHLDDARAPVSSYMTLVEERWLQSWQVFEGGHRGFVADVRRAERAIAGSKADGLLPRTGWRLRCALVLASTVNVDAQVPAALLLDCVEAGVVPPGQALAWVGRHPDGAGMLADLAPLLPEPLLLEALSISRALPEERGRAEALAALAEHLPPPRREAVRAEAIDVARAVEEAPLRVCILANLADRVPHQERTQLLAEALEDACGAEPGRILAEGLALLVPNLPEGLLDKALALARVVPDAQDRAYALTALAGRLPGPMRLDSLTEALATARVLTAPEQRAGLLAALSRALPESARVGVLAEALAAVNAIRHNWSRSEALAELARLLPLSLLPGVLGSIRAIRNPRERARALVACGSRLDEVAQLELLAEALETAQKISAEEFRAEILADLVPVLTPLQRAEVLASARAMAFADARAALLVALTTNDPASTSLYTEALTAIREVREAGRRAGLLACLARQLVSSARASLLAEALAAIRTPGDERGRAIALAAIADHMPPPRRAPILQEALEVARSIADDIERIEILAVLAGRMPAPEQERVFQEALAVARAHDRPLLRVRALIRLGVAFDAGPARAAAFEEALAVARTEPSEDGTRASLFAEVFASLPQPISSEQLPELFGLVPAFQYEAARDRFLATLVPVLPLSALKQALALARVPLAGRGRDRKGRADLLVALARRLQGIECEGLLADALAEARSVAHHQQRAEALATVADELPAEARRSVLGEALTAARAIAGPQFRAQVQAKVAIHMSGSDRTSALGEAVDIAVGISDDWGRSWALAALASDLPESLLSTALSAVQRMTEERPRTVALTAIADALPAAVRSSVLGEALASACDIVDPAIRAEALAALVTRMDEPLRTETMEAFLDCAGDLVRPDLLAMLPAFIPAIAHLDSLQGLEEARRALREVCTWFG